MGRYIDVELLKRKSKLLYIDGEIEIVYKKDQIDNIPTADVKEVVYGEWTIDEYGHKCTNCDSYIENEQYEYGSKIFCPNCGADMGS